MASCAPTARVPQAPAPQWDQALLFDPALTGMPRQQLDALTETLALDGEVRRGRPPRLTFPEQVLATVLHLRVALAAEPLAVLFGSSRTAMHRTLLKNRKLLESNSVVIPPATTPPLLLAALHARILAQTGEPHNKTKTTC
ncbi:hypothetical protein QF035_010350 [Streptomyces umbrinus]|uniref:Transposase Helix-turn-helix domain-containing protein n=1 Tax=Streptomyces umbrinus TaxID=67370 RepID=A0ABU0TAP6_9ACTN|nr:hypothetical protein [Streptomyces umbrinus]